MDYWTVGSIPWVSPKDMKSTIIDGALETITPVAAAESATSLIPPEAVLVVVRSGILRHTLPIAVSITEVALNQDLKALSPAEGVDPRFVAWALRAYEEQVLHTCTKAGTTVQSIEFERFLDFSVPLPPSAEQHRIVAALEEHLSRLDAAVAGLKRVEAELPRYRAAVLKAAVEGRLLGDLPHRTPRRTIRSDRAWARVTLEVLGEFRGGIQKQPKRRPIRNRVPFLRVANVGRGRLDLAEVHEVELFEGELQRYRLARGDLLIVEGNGSIGEIGRMAVWDGSIDPVVHQNHLIRHRPGSRVRPEWIATYWNSPDGSSEVKAAAGSTSGLYTLSIGKLRKIPIPLPSVEEQDRILSDIDRHLSLAGAVAREVKQGLARAARMRQAILKQAFEGKLVPQDPTEEPADRLLARIRAERSAQDPTRRRRHPTPARHR